MQLAAGIPFVSDAQLQAALQQPGSTRTTPEAVVEVNEQARLDGLRAALALLAIIAVIALFFTKRIPQQQPGSAGGRQRCVTLKDPCFTRSIMSP